MAGSHLRTRLRGANVRARLAVGLAVVVAMSLPAGVLAHPLGNFTINHYAGIRVSPSTVALDAVIDFAEIPAFQERRTLDTDGDSAVSASEVDSARRARCAELAGSLELTVDGATVALRPLAAGISFAAGAGGLPTMRLVCGFEAALSGGLGDGLTFAFTDRSYGERLGWREIVVLGDGAVVSAVDGLPALTTSEVSRRLTAYPADLLAAPPDVRRVDFVAVEGGGALSPFVPPDATPLDGTAPATDGRPVPAAEAQVSDAPVPGGVGAELPGLFRAADLSPLLALVSIVVAAALGAGHALTPGHGKTLMAAYLVGTRGSIRQALGLGLSVTVSHTLGILALALLATGAEAIVPPEALLRVVPIVAALGFVGVGAWMLVAELRRRHEARASVESDARAHELEHEHGHEHGHEHPHGHGHPHEHEREPAHGHGPFRHSHRPPAGTVGWRSLFALGLAGGIIPSTNALIILLGAMVTGRAAFGIVLVVAFGLGMAAVLVAIGVSLVLLQGRVERLPSRPGLDRVVAAVPLGAAFAVLGVGLWLTVQSITATPTL